MESRELLRGLGLSTYEAEVYEALLKLGQAKVQDLARVTSVPRPQIYVALGALCGKGMCREMRGKVTAYAAVAPGIAFRGLLKQEEAHLKVRTEGIRGLDKVYQQRKPESMSPDFVQVLRGRQVRHFIDEQAAQAKEELLILMKYTHAQSAKSLEGAARSETALLERGVQVRCLYEAASLEHTEIIPILRRLMERGEQGRAVPSVPLDMMVFDRRAALFSLTTQPGEVTVFAFSHPDLIQVMRLSFEHLWHEGRSLRELLKQRAKGTSPRSVARARDRRRR
jgi:sugar-specific transcriptional regulator TrmB